ncbi:MAG: homoserine dehydrogenase [Gemmatimonadaceae bacterium]|jgi:homoserine dehydrogenase|nr:homoserine dehydrogenase [Gemmatimonadaceae bacterium]
MSAVLPRTRRADAARSLPTDVAGRRTPTLALAGCGVVGSALLRLLDEDALPGCSSRDVAAVLVRDAYRPREVAVPADRFTHDVRTFAAVRSRVVVEALVGVEPALALARATLRRGARYVTANKQLVATHGAELARLAVRHGGALDFEAAAGGAVPVVRALRDGLAGTGVHAVRGVLNGTTNFVLTAAMAGTSVEAAVRDAQARGFAEADPSRDLDGHDAADKVRLLAWLAFGVAPHQLPVTIEGFAPAAERLEAARARGAAVRQVAEVRRTTSGLEARVALQLLDADDPLASVQRERNRVVVESRSAGALVFEGPGAGGDATAGAIIADLRRGGAALPGQRVVRLAAPETGE